MDISYLLFLQHLREITHGMFNAFFTDISDLGRTLPALLVISGIFWCISKRVGRYLLLGLGATRLMGAFLKITACVYRPWIQDPRIVPIKGATATATGYSFPSGHTVNAMSYLGALALLKNLSKPLRWTCIILVLLVMFSRNFLGVHTPQDVLVACVVSGLILWGIYHLNERLETDPKKDIWILLVGVLLSMALCLYANLKSYPLDYDAAGKLLVDPIKNARDAYKAAGLALGIVLGWFIEKHWIDFDIEGSWQTRCLRYMWGVLGLFVYIDICYPLIKNSMPDCWGLTIGYALEGLYITCLAPLCMKYFSRKK